jgi:hypothetical protein
MISRALAWLMAKAGQMVMGGLGVTLAVGATVLDQLAWLLTRAAQLSAQLAVHVKTLIGAIFRFLGRKAAETVDVTVAFLCWLLQTLFSSLRAVGQRALTMLNR